jgi:hypothetical protein
VIPAFLLLPFESTVSSTLKTIQCNTPQHESERGLKLVTV